MSNEATEVKTNDAVAAPVGHIVMPEFSQGVCEDGTAILMDGQPLTIEDILERLRCGACDEIDATRYRKLRSKHWSDEGIAVVERAEDIKLGSRCLSHEMLDDALDAEA